MLISNPQLKLLLVFLGAIVMIGLAWLWGHLRMASGIEDPAEWFEFKQLPGSMLKSGSKLVL